MFEPIRRRIREIMQYYNLNISQLAEKIDVNQANLSSMLNGKRVIGDGVINKICISFDNINRDWLVSGKGDMHKDRAHPGDLLQLYLKDKGITKEEFANKMGISIEEVDKHFSLKDGNMDYMFQWAKALGTGTTELFMSADTYLMYMERNKKTREDGVMDNEIKVEHADDYFMFSFPPHNGSIYIGSRLFLFIQSLGISLEEFAKGIGVSEKYISRSIQENKSLNTFVVSRILEAYPQLNIDWLLTGKGDMLKSDESHKDNSDIETRPRIPLNAAAGSVSVALSGVKTDDCEHLPFIPAFSNYNYTILVKGDSMEPEFKSGDELACLQLTNGKAKFIQWGRYHVLDTAQGIVVKRIYDSGDYILCKSENKELYPDFQILKEDIYNIGLVIGMLRRF